MDQSLPLVSVVIPSYNHRHFIGHAIDSVLQQTYKNVECIIIDDGSKDGSLDYLQQSYGQNPRIKIHSRENRGAHYTINEALGYAKGHYLSILNSDDIYFPSRLSMLVDEAERKTGSFFGITALEIIDDNGLIKDDAVKQYYSNCIINSSKFPMYSGLLSGNIAMTTSNFFFSRDVFERFHGFRSLRYTHDWDWALRIASQVGIIRLETKLLKYRVHNSNTISETNIWKHICENSFVFSTFLNAINLKGDADKSNPSTSEIMAALLHNDSFLPLPTLYLLSTGRSVDTLERQLNSGDLEDELKRWFEQSNISFETMLSSNHVNLKLASSQTDVKKYDDDRFGVNPFRRLRDLQNKLKTAAESLRNKL